MNERCFSETHKVLSVRPCLLFDFELVYQQMNILVTSEVPT